MSNCREAAESQGTSVKGGSAETNSSPRGIAVGAQPNRRCTLTIGGGAIASFYVVYIQVEQSYLRYGCSFLCEISCIKRLISSE